MTTNHPHEHYIALAERLEQLAFTMQLIHNDRNSSLDCLEAAQFIRDRPGGLRFSDPCPRCGARYVHLENCDIDEFYGRR